MLSDPVDPALFSAYHSGLREADPASLLGEASRRMAPAVDLRAPGEAAPSVVRRDGARLRTA